MALPESLAYFSLDNPQIANLLLSVPLLSLALALERIWPLYEPRSTWRHDLLNVSLRSANVLVSIIVSILVFDQIRSSYGEVTAGEINLLPCPSPLRALLGLFVLDLSIFLFHWTTHHVPLFWRFHKVHHSDEDVNASTAFRFHPMEVLVSMLFLYPVSLLFVPSAREIFWFLLIQQVVTLFHHSNILMPERWDRYLRWVIVTPRMHRIHHSAKRKESDSNYGVIFSFWDRCFGTYRRRV